MTPNPNNSSYYIRLGEEVFGFGGHMQPVTLSEIFYFSKIEQIAALPLWFAPSVSPST